ncbi:hypothetical protein SAMN02745216_02134 [Desulfatibacillum alkenivorans DSM 16219]|jgi:hypothetical protein|uniref:Uncharacterized protein n=1 Tax=Desulfatibacillum alkenivorans DSM 16219 TaxID=1121393 RepID=A0A1M6LNA6_9BACT|nr:hypothetical protein [Desulfatibacillum alkenivorans]SHJ72640.1 hypothetical protein SAMN02745216_02134 [Desulfatibacillum alkenivorans DSM 16219]
MSYKNKEKITANFRRYKVVSVLFVAILFGIILNYVAITNVTSATAKNILSAMGYNSIAVGLIGFTFEWLIRSENRSEIENLILFNPTTIAQVIRKDKVGVLVSTLCKAKFPDSEIKERVLHNILDPIFLQNKYDTTSGPWSDYKVKIELKPVDVDGDGDEFDVTIRIRYYNETLRNNYLKFSRVETSDELDKRLGFEYEWVYFNGRKDNTKNLKDLYDVTYASVDGIELEKDSHIVSGSDAIDIRCLPKKDGDLGNIKGNNRLIEHEQKIHAIYSEPYFFYKFPTLIKNFEIDFTIEGNYNLYLRMNNIVLSGGVDVSQLHRNHINLVVRDYCPIQGKLMFIWKKLSEKDDSKGSFTEVKNDIHASNNNNM